MSSVFIFLASFIAFIVVYGFFQGGFSPEILQRGLGAGIGISLVIAWSSRKPENSQSLPFKEKTSIWIKKVIEYIKSRKGMERLGIFVSCLFGFPFLIFIIAIAFEGNFDFPGFLWGIFSILMVFTIPYTFFWGIGWVVKGFK
jgi:hypothetical protein